MNSGYKYGIRIRDSDTRYGIRIRDTDTGYRIRIWDKNVETECIYGVYGMQKPEMGYEYGIRNTVAVTVY